MAEGTSDTKEAEEGGDEGDPVRIPAASPEGKAVLLVPAAGGHYGSL